MEKDLREAALEYHRWPTPGKISVRPTKGLTNLRIGYRIDRRTQLALDVYNLFDKEVNDIEYWYDSQLPNETGPVFDRHIHPAKPQTFRLTFAYRF